jgi:multiple antibiotic resistance protein
VLTTTGFLSAFVTLLVTIGPVETGAVFMGLTSGVHRPERRSLAVRAVLIAGALLMAFALGGVVLLRLLHVSLPAFRVAGGLLLFMQAVTLVFSSPGLSSISEGEKREAREPGDIAVFPLAFPLIAGPGSLSAIVLLAASAGGLVGRVVLLGVLALCLVLTLAAMLASDWLVDKLGSTGADVVSRISGLLLSALAVQFVFDGLSEAPFLAPAVAA